MTVRIEFNLVFILTLWLCLNQSEPIKVNTKYGDIVGTVRFMDYKNMSYEAQRFLGIPYAQAPVGRLRFKKPQPITKSFGVLLADTPGNACPQSRTPSVKIGKMAEDCLYLNIYLPGLLRKEETTTAHQTNIVSGDGQSDGRANDASENQNFINANITATQAPPQPNTTKADGQSHDFVPDASDVQIHANTKTTPTSQHRNATKADSQVNYDVDRGSAGGSTNSPNLAVMIFIHGGGFVQGAGELFVSDTLATFGDVIVVTINYRLGVFGFLSTGDEHAPGNVGLWDQQLAIQWVHDNIMYFGGDPDRITIFGESSGATSVLLQAMFPPNKKLIRRFISESGSGLVDGVFSLEAKSTTNAIASLFSCDSPNSLEVVECLQNVSFEELLNDVNTYIAGGNLPILKIAPTMDGEFMRMNPKKLMFHDTEERITFQSLDGIIGVNSHEGAFAVKWLAGATDIDKFEPDSQTMRTQLLPIGLNVVVTNRESSEALLKTALAEYTNWTKPGDMENIRSEFVRLMGDVYFTASSVILANIHSNRSSDCLTNTSTYFYTFKASPSNRLVETPSWIHGANHADELGFVFGFDTEAVPKMFPEKFISPNSWEVSLSEEVMRYWTNFVKFGNPNSRETNVTWPIYNVNSRKSILLDETSKETEFPFARAANFWYDVIPSIKEITLTCTHHQTTNGGDFISPHAFSFACFIEFMVLYYAIFTFML